MAKVSKNMVALLVIAVGILAIGGFKYYQSRNGSNDSIDKPVELVKLPARALGNPKAAIKIIEFIDFQCPACANGAKLLHDYLEKYPGKMYVELRYFPLRMHQHGLTSARWGECAARQDKFWPFLNPLLESQSSWSALTDPVPAFTSFAQTANIDMAQLNVCLTDQSVDVTINADLEEGKMRKVSSTPSYFINHELVVGTKSLQSRLDDLLGVKKEAPRETLKYDRIETD